MKSFPIQGRTLALLVVILPLLALFAWLRKYDREPSTPVKIFIGLLIMSFAMFIMVVASWMGGNSDTPIMSPMWLITCYLFVTLAEILISPMGQSYVSKVAPPRIQGLMMGGWFASTALGSLTSGIFGAFYSKMSRDEWHDALVDWKAQVVISGHMHRTAYLPGNEDFPYAQLVGGGPKPNQATWIEGKADEKTTVVDAEASYESVLLTIKLAVWNML